MQNLESYVAYYTKTKNFKIRKLYTLAKIEGERGPSFKLIQAHSKSSAPLKKGYFKTPKQFFERITVLSFGSKYSRMDQVKFVEDSL